MIFLFSLFTEDRRFDSHNFWKMVNGIQFIKSNYHNRSKGFFFSFRLLLVHIIVSLLSRFYSFDFSCSMGNQSIIMRWKWHTVINRFLCAVSACAIKSLSHNHRNDNRMNSRNHILSISKPLIGSLLLSRCANEDKWSWVSESQRISVSGKIEWNSKAMRATRKEPNEKKNWESHINKCANTSKMTNATNTNNFMKLFSIFVGKKS